MNATGADTAELRSEARRQALAIAVACSAAIVLVALIVLVYMSNQSRDRALAAERHSYEVMVLSGALDASMARAEAALGRFVIDGRKETGTVFYDEWRRAGRQLDQLARVTSDSPRQSRLVTALRQAYAKRGEELAAPATRANYRQGWPALSLYAEAGKSPQIARITALLTAVAETEQVQLRHRANTASARSGRADALVSLLAALGIVLTLLACGMGWLAFRALAEHRLARAEADAENDRAAQLEVAVTARTRELSTANKRLRHEAATRAEAEAKLRQIQKMEAVGQLTGGIAHDFNNMLSVVLGGLELARRRVRSGPDEILRHIDNAMDGANRAAALTRRLLSFARAEPLLPAGVFAGQLLDGLSDMIDRTIGERIAVRIEHDSDLWPVWVDPYQLENAILNLAVNARDAMNGEGRLTLAARNITLRDGDVTGAGAGEYVGITVTDNGIGMSPAVLERVFEPFFTTKPAGQGTGLGLSQIFGFARQSGGDVAIVSTERVGTAVTIYLPRHRAEVRPIEAPAPAITAPAKAAGETILVVEDDPRVRSATVNALSELGYQPIAVGASQEALALLDSRQDIRMMVTDVVMPGMNGPELVALATKRHSRLGILFVTGFVGDAGEAGQFAGHSVLRKPFTIAALGQAVSAILDNTKARAA